MENEIVINATPGETRVAIMERRQFADLYIERTHSRSIEGAIIKGRVMRVLPGIQAAFVNIGFEKAAFLYAGDYAPESEGESNAGPQRRSARDVPDIGTLLRAGDEIVVQIAKAPIGSKGARVTSHISIAGRHLVLTPWSRKVGVSRRINSERERRRLQHAVAKVKPDDLGFIIRTAGESLRPADVEADVKYLTNVWDDIQIHKKHVRAPAVLYQEPELALRAIRDFTGPATKRVVVDSPETFARMRRFVDESIAEPKPKLEQYADAAPIFEHYGLEGAIDENLGRKVWLKSGGYLIIDQSEALTAIDVNTGSYVGKGDFEETVLRTNLEAVAEVVNQLRFRNIGGLIIIDLIDMESADNRAKVDRALKDAVRRDKARTNVMKISELGLVEMTRKRTRENLMQVLCEPCPDCEGRGYVQSGESMAHKIIRALRKTPQYSRSRRLKVRCNPGVAEQLQGAQKAGLDALCAELELAVEVQAQKGMHQEQFEIGTGVSDGGGGVLDGLADAAPTLGIPWLEGRPAEAAAAPAAAAEESAEALDKADEVRESSRPPETPAQEVS